MVGDHVNQQKSVEEGLKKLNQYLLWIWKKIDKYFFFWTSLTEGLAIYSTFVFLELYAGFITLLILHGAYLVEFLFIAAFLLMVQHVIAGEIKKTFGYVNFLAHKAKKVYIYNKVRGWQIIDGHFKRILRVGDFKTNGYFEDLLLMELLKKSVNIEGLRYKQIIRSIKLDIARLSVSGNAVDRLEPFNKYLSYLDKGCKNNSNVISVWIDVLSDYYCEMPEESASVGQTHPVPNVIQRLESHMELAKYLTYILVIITTLIVSSLLGVTISAPKP